MLIEREREVAQSCPTLSDPMDCRLPGSSVHEVFQARVLEWRPPVPSTPLLMWSLMAPEYPRNYNSKCVF